MECKPGDRDTKISDWEYFVGKKVHIFTNGSETHDVKIKEIIKIDGELFFKYDIKIGIVEKNMKECFARISGIIIIEVDDI